MRFDVTPINIQGVGTLKDTTGTKHGDQQVFTKMVVPMASQNKFQD
jgi:hypothetical protein